MMVRDLLMWMTYYNEIIIVTNNKFAYQFEEWVESATYHINCCK